MTLRRPVWLVAVFFGITFAGASVAWSCTAQPRVFSVMPESGSVGTALSVTGEAVEAHTPIEIRWNQLDGEQVGAAVADANGRFAVAVKVPDVAPGIYAMVFADPSGGVGRMVFEVTPTEVSVVPASHTGTEALWPQSTGHPSSTPSGSDRLGILAGATLVGVGSVALFAGFSAAAVRRRRVLAQGEAHNQK